MIKISKAVLMFVVFFSSMSLFGSSELKDTKKIRKNPDAILFIHGAGSSPKTFANVSPYFSENFDLYFYNTRSYQPTTEPEDLSGWTESLRGFIKQNNLSSVHLITHSFGARLAATLIKKYPELVQSLVIEDMDFEPRAYASTDPNDPMNYPAAISNLGHVFSKSNARLPVLVLSASKNEDGNAITDSGIQFYLGLEAENPDFRFVTIDHSTHNIHKSQKADYLEEVFAFYRDHLQYRDLQVVKEPVSKNRQLVLQGTFSQVLSEYMISEEQIDLKDMKFVLKREISKIRSFQDLTGLLKQIWSFRETNYEKCKGLSRYFQESRTFLIKQIYSSDYFDHSSYPQGGRVQYSPAKHPVTQLEWVLVHRYFNSSMHKSATYCPDSYGELFGHKMCMDHPVENIPFKTISPFFISVLNQLGISAGLMSKELIWNLDQNFYMESLDPDNIISADNSNCQTSPVMSARALTGTEIYDFYGHIQELYDSFRGPGVWGSDYNSPLERGFQALSHDNMKSPGLGFRLMRKRHVLLPKVPGLLRARSLPHSVFQMRNKLFELQIDKPRSRTSSFCRKSQI